MLLLVSQLQAIDYTDPVALPSLATDTYLGVQGGLYPGGSNFMPPAYQVDVDAAIAQLNADSNINFLCVGMSNLAHTCGEMIERAATADVNPAVTIGNGGRPGRAIQAYDGSSPDSVYTQFKYTNMSPGAVDVVVFFNAWGNPSGSFPTYLAQMTQAVREVYSNIQQAYPNVKLIYFVSREYAPPWAVSLNPNPYAYQDGFAYKHVIEERINDTLTGVPVAWGPYQYDESWPDSYFRQPDGVHLSPAGLDVAGQLWLDFFMTQSWFADGAPLPTSTPAPSNTPGTPTMTSEPTLTPLPSSTPTLTPTGSAATATPVCPPWAPPNCWATKTPRVFIRGGS